MEWSRMSKWWSKDWNDWIHFSSFLFFTCQNKLFQICLDVVHRKVWRESCACHKNYIRGSKRWLQRRMSMSWGGDSHHSKNNSSHIYLNSFIQVVWESNGTEMIQSNSSEWVCGDKNTRGWRRGRPSKDRSWSWNLETDLGRAAIL